MSPPGAQRGRRHLLAAQAGSRSAPARRRLALEARPRRRHLHLLTDGRVQPVSAITSGRRSLARALIASAAAWSSRIDPRAWSATTRGTRPARRPRRRGPGPPTPRGPRRRSPRSRGLTIAYGAVGAVDPLPADQQSVRVLAGQSRSSRRSLGGCGVAGSGREARLEQVLIRVPTPRGPPVSPRWPRMAPWSRPRASASGPNSSKPYRSRQVPDIKSGETRVIIERGRIAKINRPVSASSPTAG